MSSAISAGYVPDRWDVINVNFDPVRGHEQGRQRPALVLSPRSYNEASGLVIVMPITNKAKGYPDEVPIPDGLGVTGVILSSHVRTLDYAARAVTYRCPLPEVTGLTACAVLYAILPTLPDEPDEA